MRFPSGDGEGGRDTGEVLGEANAVKEDSMRRYVVKRFEEEVSDRGRDSGGRSGVREGEGICASQAEEAIY